MRKLFLRRWVSEVAFGAMRRTLFAVFSRRGLTAATWACLASATLVGAALADRRPPDLPRLGRLAVFVVQDGDTIFSIAASQGLRVDQLAMLNSTSPTVFLVPGRHLWVPSAPGGAQPTAVATASSGVAADSAGAEHATVPATPGTTSSAPASRKSIEIDVSEQHMYVWEGDTLLWSWPASTGIATHPTRRGTFAVQSKIDNAWSSPWQLWMPNWLGIYWAGGSENGIHALPIQNGRRLWAGFLGTPISYGCVVLGVEEASMLYNWAEIGTPVIIHD